MCKDVAFAELQEFAIPPQDREAHRENGTARESSTTSIPFSSVASIAGQRNRANGSPRRCGCRADADLLSLAFRRSRIFRHRASGRRSPLLGPHLRRRRGSAPVRLPPTPAREQGVVGSGERGRDGRGLRSRQVGGLAGNGGCTSGREAALNARGAKPKTSSPRWNLSTRPPSAATRPAHSSPNWTLPSGGSGTCRGAFQHFDEIEAGEIDGDLYLAGPGSLWVAGRKPSVPRLPGCSIRTQKVWSDFSV